nr:malonate decarboxylase acyl carrier protein [Derxia lacustris]
MTMEFAARDWRAGAPPDAPDAARAGAVLCGVVASGNLEVLVEPGSAPALCSIAVATSAEGFGDIWRAVLADFAARHAVGGLRLSINDAGATPAVVSLRLGQAFEAFRSAP